MTNSSTDRLAGIGSRSREQLARVLGATSGAFSPADVATILEVKPQVARNLLSRWANGGWVARVRRGLYIPCQVEHGHVGVVVEDPWIVASKVFAPCYIGGWTAAHHWGLTDQLFETVVVVTRRRLNSTQQSIGGVRFLLKRTIKRKYFGTCSVSRDGVSIEVSDEARTVLDAMDFPGLVGGIRMGGEVLEEYLRFDFADLDRLLSYAERLDSRVVFKRLGFLMEHYAPDKTGFISKCRDHVHSGYSQLDPKTPGKSRSKNWQLRMPEALLKEFTGGRQN